MTETYMDRMNEIKDIVLDPATVAQLHNQGEQWVQEQLLGGITTGEPLSLLISSLLMQLRGHTAEDVIRDQCTTLGVTEKSFMVNGVFATHPQGLIRGDMKLSRALMLHEAMHLILMHNIRVTQVLKALADAKYIGTSTTLSIKSALQLSNVIIDVVDDAKGKSVSGSLHNCSHDLLDQHHAQMGENLTYFIDTYCVGIDAASIYAAVSDESMSIENAIREVIMAVDPKQLGDAAEAMAGAECHVQMLEDDSPEGIQQAQTMQAAMVSAAGKQAGTGSALAELCMDASEWLRPPKVNWKDRLQAAVGGLSQDLSYQQIAQNDLYRGVVLPEREPGIGAIALAFDTSGSVMCDATLRAQLLTEMAEVLGGLPFETLYFMPVDADVNACIEMRPGDPIPAKHFIGGGGTSFNGPFNYVERHDVEIDMLLYFTDGFGTVSVDEPEYPVVWLIGSGSTAEHLPFGEVIDVELEGA